MGKDAISSSKSKEQSPPKDSSGTASPLILIIAVFAVILIGLYFFKDKIFKKKTKNLTDLVKEKNNEKPEPKTETKQETLPKEESEKIENKFAKQS